MLTTIKPTVACVAMLTLAFLVSANAAPLAQRRGGRNRVPPPSALLQGITGVTCSFPVSARGTWDSGAASAALQPRASVFTLTITGIDTSTGTAMSTGLGEPSEVTVQLVGSNLHLLDIRKAGALAITTVFAEESRDGRLKAVHSRSDYSGAGTSPDVSQYYGDCAVTSR